jgi:hypothetical protein
MVNTQCEPSEQRHLTSPNERMNHWFFTITSQSHDSPTLTPTEGWAIARIFTEDLSWKQALPSSSYLSAKSLGAANVHKLRNPHRQKS